MPTTATKGATDRYGFPLSPQSLDEHTWYYEEARGIVFVREVVDASGVIAGETQSFRVPWARLRESVERKDHSLATRRKRSKTAKRSVGKTKPGKSSSTIS